MNNKDFLQRSMFNEAPIRAEFVQLEESYQTILSQHPYPRLVRKLLGEALCAVVLLSALIKFDGRLTLQFRSKTGLTLLLAQCDNQLHIRGLAKWDGDIGENELNASLKEGVLAVLLDSGANNHYQGIVAWRGNSLAESLEGYFRDSEQLATKIWLNANDHSAAGLLLQIIPSANKTDSIDENASWERITSQAVLIDPEEILEKDFQTLLQQHYAVEDIRMFSPVNVAFRCSCSRKRGEDAILLLGRDEVEEELKDKQNIIVTCDFCNKEYLFDRVDITHLFETKPLMH